MTQEERELLLKDLYARLPYGVKILHEGWNYEWDDELSTVERVVGIDEHFIYTKVIDVHNGEEYRDDSHDIHMFDDKLFLRPMSSMTEEEDREWRLYKNNIACSSEENLNERVNELHDWFNKKGFDYRGLIEKGLALKAPNNMYKFD